MSLRSLIHLSLFLSLFFANAINGAKILGIFLYPSQSHHILGLSLLTELAAKGHEVTMLSTQPLLENTTPAMDKFKHIHVKLASNQTYMKHLTFPNATSWHYSQFYSSDIKFMLRDIIQEESLQTFLSSGLEFDVAIAALQNCEVFLGISHAVKARTIAFEADGNVDAFLSGNPQPYSYVPNYWTPYSDRMNFWQRFINTYTFLWHTMTRGFYSMPMQKKLLKSNFPDAPALEVLFESVDLHLVNSHYALESPRPYLPNVVQVGGLHLQKPERISVDLLKFMDESVNGLILVSFGPNVRAVDFEQSKLQVLINTLAKSMAKYNVIMKFEGQLLKVPSNMRLLNWVPQRAILSHKNTKVFVTHGGTNSILEATYYGVPMVAIPFSHELHVNVANMLNHGIGLRIPFEHMNEENFSWALEEVISNPRYKQAIYAKSSLLRNQEMNPMSKAISWVEHVAKYKGANHLKSQSRKIPLYQYILLDVAILSLTLLFVGLLISYYIVAKWCYRKYLRRRGCGGGGFESDIKHKTV